MPSRDSSGWPTIAAFASVCAGTQLLWLTYAPIDTGAAHYYGVSVSAVGWLAEIFPLLYVVLAIPAGLAVPSGRGRLAATARRRLAEFSSFLKGAPR